jgi:hemerythrin superfamily protein
MTTKASTGTATELLRKQHDVVKGMFEQLDAATGEQRVEIFDRLRATLAVHETAEEMILHPAGRLAGDDGDRVVEARLAEEAEAKSALAELEKLGPDGDGFDVKLVTFKQSVLAHAEAEENELFPLIEANTPIEKQRTMATAITSVEKIAPTHPHPHGPESAIGNTLVGPFASMVDRVRDALAGQKPPPV